MKKIFSLIFLFLSCTLARADGFAEVPTKWRLESYGANGVVLWYTPSTCDTGKVLLSSGATLADHSRLYATVLAAKASNLNMFVIYSNNSGVCTIISFGIN